LRSKVATGSSSSGYGSVWVWFGLDLIPNFEKNLVIVWFWFLRKSFSLVLLCYQKTLLQKFCNIFMKFFSNFLENMKIQYKNTFNQTKIRISQNLMFKNNNNIIFRQFENILYFEIFKCLVLGLVCVKKSQFGLVWV
jgi:hypothetical protein